MPKHRAPASPELVVLDSYLVLLVLGSGLVVYAFALVELIRTAPLNWVTWLYFLLGLVLAFGIWACTSQYEVSSQFVVERKLFGLLRSRSWSTQSIERFRERSNYAGHTTRLEVQFSEGSVTLHAYQRNFSVASALLMASCPTAPVVHLSKWTL